LFVYSCAIMCFSSSVLPVIWRWLYVLFVHNVINYLYLHCAVSVIDKELDLSSSSSSSVGATVHDEPWPLFLQFLNHIDSRQDSLDGGSAGRKAATYRLNNANTEYRQTIIHVSSRFRTHYPSVWAGEDGSCLRPRGHCDRHKLCSPYSN
jgi:hypothetical protein